ncbi:beta-glucosidase [Alloscardovia macacae]|uniref:Beta-glucosidase n=1 Tax=Alloscardovia macacae TaxID=1160091 RepID=A0A1Y2ST40_9BIFI|nr:beta-glucosidase [Alloscardovia macacae]OTA29916.1 beta-glucosidase [Alloscardovia macacae]
MSEFDEAVERVKNGSSVRDEAELLYQKLTDDEKLWLLDGDETYWAGRRAILKEGYNIRPYIMGAVDRLGIPGIRFVDGPRGCVSGQGTTFPVSMARGATWDTELEERVGEAIGEEVRENGGNYFGGVCINLPRHPAWGRAQESYAENPLLLGEMGAALTRGVKPYAMACVKHFACNSMENSRFQVNVTVDEATLHEDYLPHFKKVIENGALGVMSAYNQVNGQYCGESDYLLTKVLREDWKFSGVVGSDFVWGLRNPAKSVKAGLNIEEPFRQQRAEHLEEQMVKGEVSWDDIRRVGVTTLETQLRYYASRKDDTEVVKPDKRAHALLAREVAERSMVLLKNESHALPLESTEDSPLTLTVCGRLAALKNTGDHGSSNVRSAYVVTALDGITQKFGAEHVTNATALIPHDAAEAASHTSAAVVVVGYTANDEGEYLKPSMDPSMLKLLPTPHNAAEEEMIAAVNRSIEAGQSTFGSDAVGGDRISVRLHDEDVELIREVSRANARTIVVVVAAGEVLMDDWVNEPAGIVIGWYSGMEGGNALARILSGEANPSGRLPFAVARSEGDLPDFDSAAHEVTYTRWYGQRLIQRNGHTALYPLGYGLSYSNFSLEGISLRRETSTVLTRVKNESARKGTHVVQVYATRLDGERQGEKELVGFQAVIVEAHSAEEVEIHVDLSRIGTWDAQKREIVINGGKVRFEVASFWGDSEAESMEITL